MAFFEYLDSLRARPEAERRRLAIWLTILITLILGLLWLLNLQYIWQNTEEVPPVEEPVKEQQLGAWDRIKTGWQTITNQN